MARISTFGDWRAQFHPESRQRIINKIADTLTRHLPVSVPEGLNELKKISIRFEEKIYEVATSQYRARRDTCKTDYLQRISLKMLTMEAKIQLSASVNPSIFNVGAVNQNATDPGVPVHAPVTVSRLDCLNKRPHVSANGSITDCESYSTEQDDTSTKRQKLSDPKEPTFSCPICMHSIVSLWSTICGHVFCEDCIKVAVQNQKKCPTCRTGLTKKNGIHKVFLPNAE